MRKLIFAIVIFLIITGCKREDYSPYSYSESTIYSESATTQFREFVLIIDPFVMIGNEKQYVVTDTIKNVIIRISNKPWGVFDSFGVDTSIFVKQRMANYYATNIITKYSVIAPYKTSSDILTSAGDYSDLLSNYLTLEPGNYICQVMSFDIKQSDGSLKKIKPFIVIPVEVKENSRSSFVGEFEVEISNQ